MVNVPGEANGTVGAQLGCLDRLHLGKRRLGEDTFSLVVRAVAHMEGSVLHHVANRHDCATR